MKFSTRIISIFLLAALLISITSVTAFAKGDIKLGVAFVTGSGLRLRSEPNTHCKTLDSASKGEVVVVLSKHDDWYKVIYDLQEGYMHEDYLKVMTRENAELGYGKINGSRVNLRSGPSTSRRAVARGSQGDKAYIIGINEGWYKVIFGSDICYVRSDYLDLTETPYENRSSSNSPLFFRGGKSTGVSPSASALGSSDGSSDRHESSHHEPNAPEKESHSGSQDSGSSESTSASGQQLVNAAKKHLGTPYVWGGSSPSGFDCSGFVYYVARSCGYRISRTQSVMYQQGTPVAKSDLRPGDLVFFQNTYKSGISHVGIYVGDGQFIHSPHTGKVVSYADLNSDYYVSHYYGACRLG